MKVGTKSAFTEAVTQANTMNTINSPKLPSTYSLLAHEEQAEAGRNLFEAAIYGLFLICTVVTVWQVAMQATTLPRLERAPVFKVAQASSSQQPG